MKRAEFLAAIVASNVLICLTVAACGGGGAGGGATACGNAGVCPNGLVCSGGYCVSGNLGGAGGIGAQGGTGPIGGVGGMGGFGATGGIGGAGVDPVAPGAQPPPAPSGPAANGSGATIIAVDKLLYGDCDANFAPNANAWRTLGYNLDGLISTKTGTNHCAPQPLGTKTMVQTDGENGIDNSYGANIIPIMSSLAADVSKTITESVRDGSFTLIFRFENLEEPAISPNQTGILGAFYAGAKFDSLVDCSMTPTNPNCNPPKFDGTDLWPVKAELLNNGNINDPKITFPASYLSNGTWVSGGSGTLPVLYPGFGSVPILRAVVTAQLSGAGPNAKAVNGVIAGVIPTAELITEMKKTAGLYDSSLCDGPTFDGIAQQIAAASDIMSDGSNGDPTKTCDAISIGIGFEGSVVQLGGVAPAESPPTDPCAP